MGDLLPHRYGPEAAELLQTKDPSGDVVGGVVGLAAAALAEEGDPDEEFAVDLARPNSRALLEAKLLDARIDGRMTPQEVGSVMLRCSRFARPSGSYWRLS